MTSDLMAAILVEGLDDWVPLRAVDAAARRLVPRLETHQRREMIIETVGNMLDRGLAEAGVVTETDGYRALGEPTPAVLKRIRDAFLDTDPEAWEYAVWLNNTVSGDAVARRAESST